MAPEGSLPCSQEHAIGPCSESDEYSPHLPPSFFEINFNINPHVHLRLPSGLFPSGFQPKFYMHLSSLTCMLRALPPSSSS
jgi:hypothetical protein